MIEPSQLRLLGELYFYGETGSRQKEKKCRETEGKMRKNLQLKFPSSNWQAL
jgi:hypothetical protein